MKYAHSRNIIFALASLIIISFSSCLKPVEYPDEPEITSVNHTFIGDSLQISFEFTDGDGNIGLGQTDTIAPFDAGSIFHHNVRIEYYEMMEGEWVLGRQDPSGNNFITADSIVFGYRIQNLEPIGQNKTLKGTINIVIEAPYYNPLSNHNDSIKYLIYLNDRDLNVSNPAETEMIVR